MSQSEPIRDSKPAADKLSPIHVLLICLVVVGIVFGGSIALSVLYVENIHGVQSDQPPDP